MDGNSAIAPIAAPRETTAPASAYLLDADTEGVVRRCFADLGYSDALVVRGGIETAIEQLTRHGWPRFLIVDVSGLSDPMPQINRLAEVCDPETEVIVVGDRNDIVLYRDLRAAGVAEYFFKPVVGALITRALSGIAKGPQALQIGRAGKLVFMLGARGGVGVTTIATSLAWHLAEDLRRRVLLLDLNLRNGDAALQLDAQPSHALREALEDPSRIDELFLERGVASVTKRLALLAGLESLSGPLAVDEKPVTVLLQKVVQHYRYIIVDLPHELASSIPQLLHMPSTLLLVSDGGIAGARDVSRWREQLGDNTADRSLLHILNRQGADGALPEKELLRMVPRPDVTVRWDRQIMTAAPLGAKEVLKCSAMRDGIAALSRQLSGVAPAAPASLWKRIFG
jgi:pilus assembly protein CpaE